MIEVNFAAHQPMQPFRAHGKALAEQIDVAGLIDATNEDDVPAEWRMRVKFEVLGHLGAAGPLRQALAFARGALRCIGPSALAVRRCLPCGNAATLLPATGR